MKRKNNVSGKIRQHDIPARHYPTWRQSGRRSFSFPGNYAFCISACLDFLIQAQFSCSSNKLTFGPV